MRTWAAVAGAVGMVLSAPVMAGVLGGASGFKAYRDYDDVENPTGYKIFLGYRPDAAPWMLELSYTKVGDAEVERLAGATSNLQLGFEGIVASAAWLAQRDDRGSALWLRGGAYHGETTAKIPLGALPADPAASGRAEESGSGLALGVGGVLKVTPWFGIRAEYERLVAVKDFSADEDIGMVSLGLEFELGGRSRSASISTAAVPAAVVPAAPEAIAEDSMPAAAAGNAQQAPAAGVQAGPVTPLMARARVATGLRTRPQAAAPVEKTLLPGELVELETRRENRDGAWWFARAENLQGWVAEADLIR